MLAKNSIIETKIWKVFENLFHRTSKFTLWQLSCPKCRTFFFAAVGPSIAMKTFWIFHFTLALTERTGSARKVRASRASIKTDKRCSCCHVFWTTMLNECIIIIISIIIIIITAITSIITVSIPFTTMICIPAELSPRSHHHHHYHRYHHYHQHHNHHHHHHHNHHHYHHYHHDHHDHHLDHNHQGHLGLQLIAEDTCSPCTGSKRVWKEEIRTRIRMIQER